MDIRLERVNMEFKTTKNRGVWRYESILPLKGVKERITMGEGATPLVRLSKEGNCYIKHEGMNPTGSFKDRGMTVAVTLAKHLGYRKTIAASTGNTAASASAYSSRAAMIPILILPKGKVALGKLAQSIFYGARIIELPANFDEAMKIVRSEYDKINVYPLNSFNSWRLEGQKTIAFEIFEEIGIPDFIILPVGNGGNISAIWKGFMELLQLGASDSLPRMVAVQAEGASPIVDTIENKSNSLITKERPETMATAINIGNPVNWKRAISAIRESRGIAIKVSDLEIRLAQQELAMKYGIGAEPASASSYAGYKKLLEIGKISKRDISVLILTGNSLKDPDSMLSVEKHIYTVSEFTEALRLLQRLGE